jgi:hypothetical protein
MSKKSEFSLIKAKEIHGDKYDYSQVIYNGNNVPVKIICPIHGLFEKKPNTHISGKQGCPKCALKSSIDKRSGTLGDFIKKSKLIHGDKYDYSLVDYVNNYTKVKIICSIHGEFEQSPNKHLDAKHGCHICAKELIKEKLNRNNYNFIIEAKKIHGDKYDYSNITYIFNRNPIKIICPEHGEFSQKPNDHLQGNGCIKCGIDSSANTRSMGISNFIKKSKLIHGDKYDYSKVEYVNNHTNVVITCIKHGEFKQTPDCHLRGQECPKCNSNISKKEIEVLEYIKSIYSGIIITNDKKILEGSELDIYLPDIKLAIEFDGLYWHNELKKPINYHLDKTKTCLKQDIKLIHIFEDEWDFKPDIIKSMIRNKIGLIKNKIYARKCIIKEVNIKDSKEFLDYNHLQGNVVSKLKLGLYYNDTLISLMTFNEPRSAKSNVDIDYELNRFCNKLNINVIGGASKLLKYFIKKYKPKNILSYADLRWSNGDLYQTLGFTEIHRGRPNYFYVINGRRYNKGGFRKNKLLKMKFDINKSEHEIMLGNGVYRIYDCGKIRFELSI